MLQVLHFLGVLAHIICFLYWFYAIVKCVRNQMYTSRMLMALIGLNLANILVQFTR